MFSSNICGLGLDWNWLQNINKRFSEPVKTLLLNSLFHTYFHSCTLDNALNPLPKKNWACLGRFAQIPMSCSSLLVTFILHFYPSPALTDVSMYLTFNCRGDKKKLEYVFFVQKWIPTQAGTQENRLYLSSKYLPTWNVHSSKIVRLCSGYLAYKSNDYSFT